MNCAISEKQQQNFLNQVAKDLHAIKEGSTFIPKDYMLDIYNLVNGVSQDHELALEYVRLTPIFIDQLSSYNRDIRKNLKESGVSMDELSDLVLDFTEEMGNLQSVSDYLGLEVDEVADLIEANEDVSPPAEKPELEELTNETRVAKTPVNRGSMVPFAKTLGFTEGTLKYAPGAFYTLNYNPNSTSKKDLWQEDRNNPNNFYYKVKRNILKIMNNSGTWDSSQLSFGKFGTPVYLTLTPISAIKDDVGSDVDFATDLELTGAFMVLTDKSGTPYRFDTDGNPVLIGGDIAYYRVPTVKAGVIQLDSAAMTHIKNSAKLSYNGNLDAAKEAYIRDMELLRDMREYINKENENGDKVNRVQTIINGGSVGHAMKDNDPNNFTPIRELDFGNNNIKFAPHIASVENPAKGEKVGFTYFQTDGFYDQSVEVERPEAASIMLSDGSTMADKIVSLLVDDIQQPNGKPYTAANRRKLIDYFIKTGPEGIQYSTKGVIRLAGTVLPTGTPANKEAARKKLSDYFTNYSPQQITNSSSRRVPVEASGIYTKGQNGYVIEQRDGTIKEYRRIGRPKLHVKKGAKNINVLAEGSQIPDVNLITDENGQITAEPNSYNYSQYVFDNFSVSYIMDGKQIRKFDAQFSFQPTEQAIAKMTPKGESKAEKIETEVKANPISEVDDLGGPIETEDIGKLLKDVNKDKKLDKLSNQKVIDIAATEKQLEEAKVWWEDHPQLKHLPFESLFHLVNTDNPNSIATFSMAGVTLYEGSDYSDLYHEAWHAFTQGFLTKGQKQYLYKEARKKSGSFKDHNGKLVTFNSASDLQIEEYLAEDFRKYMLRGGKPKGNEKVKNSIFRDIWNTLKALFSGTTMAQIAADETADGVIGEMYEKLRVGNLYEYTFSADNVQFGELNKGVVATDNESAIQALSYEDSKLLVDSLDSLFSEWEDMKNSNLTLDQMLDVADLETQLDETDNVQEKASLQTEIDSYGAKKTYEFTSEVFKDTNKNRLPAYKYARTRIGNMFNKKREEYLAADNQVTKDRLKKDALLLQWAWRNFGTIEVLDASGNEIDAFENADLIMDKNKFAEGETIKGLMGYHMDKSEKYFENFEEKLDNEDMDETDVNVKGRRYEGGGNDLSMKEQADARILYLMKGLHKTGEDNKKLKNRLGFNQLVEFQEVWNRTARTLQNTLDIEVMEQKLNAEVGGYPVFDQLLNKLGPVDTGKVASAGDEVALWTNFWQAFNKTRVPLVQVNIQEKTKKVKGKRVHEARSGEAHNNDTKIGRRWENEFHNGTTKYIQHDIQGNYLDLDVLMKDFPSSASLQGKEREFLHAIGWKIADHPKVLENLAKKDDVLWIYKTVAGIHARGLEVRKFDDITTIEAPAERIGGKPWIALETIKSGRYKRVMQFHSKYSDESSNFLVTNTEGNNQYEHSSNNSLTIMINAINTALDYQSLIAMPHMAHLNMENNPFSKYSNLLNSIYNLDTTDPDKYGKKRELTGPGSPVNQIDFSNLSGIMLSNEEDDTGIDGVAAAKADPVTKLILDFHLNGQLGISELARHADKSTSYSASARKVKTKTGLQSKWINNHTFLHGKDVYNDEAYDLLINPIAAEFNRIKIMRDMTEPKNIDFAYWEAGKNFVAFDDVLVQKTQQLLLQNLDQATDLKAFLATEAGAPLQAAIRTDLANYFARRVDITAAEFNKNPFVAENLYKDVRKEAVDNGFTGQVKDSDAKDALIKSYVYNHWINNIETINLFYGDLALFNHKKEQFHKRNAGMGSTGTLYRTDKAMQNLVNYTLGRPYSDTKGGDYDPYNGSFSTAVIRDNNVKSAYYDDYVKAFAKQFEKEDKLSPKAAKAKAEKVLYAYSGAKGGQMNEGDAQGWISFDSYRILLNSEGKWSSQQENLYQDVIKGKPISADQLMTFFPTVKAQYYGPLQNDMDGLPVTAMHKFSLLPLIPTVIKGTNLENLHQKMMTEGIDYSLFESGSKVGTITKEGESDAFYQEGRRELSEAPFTKNTIFVNYLKNQLEIAPEYKGKTIFSTQLRKLIEDGLMENGVPSDFMEKTNRKNSKAVAKRIAAWKKLGVYKKGKLVDDSKMKAESKRYRLVKDYEDNIALLTDIKKRQLLTEMNWTSKMVNGQEVLDGDIKDLVKKVKIELSRQDIADHELDFLDTVNGKLKQDLSLSLSVDKIEKLLNALVVNKLIKQKVRGEGLVQISGALFESMGSTGDRSYENPTDEQLEKYGTNDLPTYHIGKDGKTTAMKVKIALQGDFLLLLDAKHNDGTRIRNISRLNEMVKDDKWLNTDRNRDMITMTGVRIPVQGLNSMEFMEVYEFLPKEAGNIIVPPAEIVAKSGSDFDIDKLSVMMPNLKKRSKANAYTRMFNYTEAEAKEDYKRYVKARKSPFFEKAGAKIDRKTGEREIKSFEDYNSLVALLGFEDVYDIDAEIESILLETGEIKTEQEFMDSLIGAKSVENDLIANIKSILELPENFVNLVRPNSTDIFTNEEGTGIAQELKDFVLEYNPTDVMNGKTRTDSEGNEMISPTRVLEVEYNMYKHATNNIGKQTLGLGAVDNTYNTIFNRIGFHLNPTIGISTAEYNKIKAKPFGKQTPKEKDLVNKYRRQKLFLPHNTLEVGGEDAISLSHDKDANGEHRIADVINQLLNGWVDIAADTWIFNIQGNKEVSPILLFLLQAGVPAKSAVYFASMPMVRDYVKAQRDAKGTLAKPLNKAPKDDEGNFQPFWFRHEARKQIFKNPVYGFDMDAKQLKNIKATVNKEATAQVSGDNLNAKGNFDEQKMLNVIKDYSKATKAGKEYEHSPMERAAFLHFLEVEAMAMPVRDVKLSMNFDTSKSETLFEAQNRIIMKEKLKIDGRIPTEMIEKMLDESPIGSFYIQPFQMEMWKDLFTLRNHKALNDFIVSKMGDPDFSDDVKATFGDTEKFANELRNDFVNFIFQNSVRSFDSNTKTYRNYEIKQEIYDIKTEIDKIPEGTDNKKRVDLEKKLGKLLGIPVSDVTALRYGITREVKKMDTGTYILDNQLYVDKRQLNKDYADGLYAKAPYIKRGLAQVNSQAFDTVDEYYNFVYERESLREAQPAGDVNDNLVYKNIRSRVGSEEGNEQKEDENDDSYDKRLNKIAYEDYLRDTALTNTFNHWSLFKSDNSYADQFNTIRDVYGEELAENYSIIDMLSIDSTSNHTNLKLNDNFLESDSLNLLHENILNLSNPNIQKVANPVDNKIISEFFKKMGVVAFLQSGMNTKSAFSLTRIVPEDTYLRMVEGPVKEYVKHLDKSDDSNLTPPILEKFYDMFVSVNGVQNRGSRIRGKKYNTEYKLSKSIKDLLIPIQDREAVIEPDISPYLVEVGTEGMNSYYSETFEGKASRAKSILQGNPNLAFVYSFAIESQAATKSADSSLYQTGQKNAIGLPLLNTFKDDMNQLKDVDGTISEENRIGIEDGIRMIKEAQASGKRIAWNRDGYGQYMIGEHFKQNDVAKETFLYLSKRLFEEFKFINPNYLATPEGLTQIQSGQPISDAVVYDFMQHCK